MVFVGKVHSGGQQGRVNARYLCGSKTVKFWHNRVRDALRYKVVDIQLPSNRRVDFEAVQLLAKLRPANHQPTASCRSLVSLSKHSCSLEMHLVAQLGKVASLLLYKSQPKTRGRGLILSKQRQSTIEPERPVLSPAPGKSHTTLRDP